MQARVNDIFGRPWRGLGAAVPLLLLLLALSATGPTGVGAQQVDWTNCTDFDTQILPPGYDPGNHSYYYVGTDYVYVTWQRKATEQEARDTVANPAVWDPATCHLTNAYGDVPGSECEYPPDPSKGPNNQDFAEIYFSRDRMAFYIQASKLALKAQAEQIAAAIDRNAAAAVARGCQAAPTATATATETPVPTVAAVLDLTVQRVEIVQVVQDEQNSVPLYAGKPTLLRVFVGVNGANSDVDFVTGELRIFGWHDENGVPVEPEGIYFTAPLHPDRANLDDSLNFDVPTELLPAISYPIRVTINDDFSLAETDYANNSFELQLVMLPSRSLRVGWMEVGYPQPGGGYIWPSGPLGAFDGMLHGLYPSDDAHLIYYQLPFRAWSPVTPDSALHEHDMLVWLRGRYDWIQSNRPEALPDLIVGWAGDLNAAVPPHGGMSQLIRDTYLPRVSWVVDQTNTGEAPAVMERSLAHELGHDLGLYHPGTHDPNPPCHFAPTIVYSSTLNGSPLPYWPYSDGQGTTHELGYNPDSGELQPPTRYDLMNYCPADQTWISEFHYNRLAQYIERYEKLRGVTETALAEQELDLIVSGELRFDGGGGKLNTAFKLPAAPVSSEVIARAPAQSGSGGLRAPAAQGDSPENCIQFRDAGNKVLGEHCFDLAFAMPETGDRLDADSFSLRLRYPDATQSVVLLRNGREVDRLSESGAAPQVSITAPSAGATLDGQATIQWSAQSASGETLSYAVQYSPDGGQSWFPLDLGERVAQGRLTFSTQEIAGGSDVLFRVLASDGLSTALAAAGPVHVPNSPSLDYFMSGATGKTGTGGSSGPNSPAPAPANAILWIVVAGVAGVAGGLLVLALILALTRRPVAAHPYGTLPGGQAVRGPRAERGPGWAGLIIGLALLGCIVLAFGALIINRGWSLPGIALPSAASPTVTFRPGATPQPSATSIVVHPRPPTQPPPDAEQNVTAQGTLALNETYPAYSAKMVVDGKRTTSWFSPGSVSEDIAFGWTYQGAEDLPLSSVVILSNAQHADAALRTAHGFEAVTVWLFSASGEVVEQQTASLAGTPDPDVTFHFEGVAAHGVLLHFAGCESTELCGFSELQVWSR